MVVEEVVEDEVLDQDVVVVEDEGEGEAVWCRGLVTFVELDLFEKKGDKILACRNNVTFLPLNSL